MLVDAAAGLVVDAVRTLVVRAEAWLDPDGAPPRDEERRARRSVTMFERDGMVHLNAVLDAESAAPVVTAVRGFVSAAFAARKDAPDSDAVDADRRTVPMIQADALVAFCAHVVGCDTRMPVAGATVIVRMSLADLESGTGVAKIDGIETPVSVGAARRMAAGGGVISWVMGADSEILDWGRGEVPVHPSVTVGVGGTRWRVCDVWVVAGDDESVRIDIAACAACGFAG
ncbi:DUF222 domain-containing protein [Microbacterium sp. NPDC087591]|uniref:DUF222 domain-containing protein n=1 Tax=Microbacterium sp. NPDC087591 TaxID=3364192 RepID=UPI00382DF2FF